MHELDIDKVVVHMGVGESGEKALEGNRYHENDYREHTGQEYCKKDPARIRDQERRPDRVPCYPSRVESQGIPRDLRSTSSSGRLPRPSLTAGVISHSGSRNIPISRGCRTTLRSVFTAWISMSSLQGKGIRISRRHHEQKKLPEKQHVNVADAISFLKTRYKVEV